MKSYVYCECKECIWIKIRSRIYQFIARFCVTLFPNTLYILHCTCSERLKNVPQVRFYLIKNCGLLWVTTWPQMNQPNNIPFWGLKANLNQIQIQSFPPHFMAMRVTKKCISWLIKISLWYHPQHGIWELRVKIPNKMTVFVLNHQ